MNEQKTNPQDFLPLAPTAYHILLSLIGNSRHGYEIMKIVEEEMKAKVPSPKIYRHLRKMTEEGLIEIDEKMTALADDERRRYYKITGLGQTVCIDETKRLSDVVGNAQGLLGGLFNAIGGA